MGIGRGPHLVDGFEPGASSFDPEMLVEQGEVKDLRCEMQDLKEALAEQVLENRSSGN